MRWEKWQKQSDLLEVVKIQTRVIVVIGGSENGWFLNIFDKKSQQASLMN